MTRIQVRSEKQGLLYFTTLREAVAHAQLHKDVWKISFEGPDGERVRLVRNSDDQFYYEEIMTEGNNDNV